MSEEIEKYCSAENLKKKDRHAVLFTDWLLAVILTKLENNYLENLTGQTVLEQMQTDERMRALLDVWDCYRDSRKEFIVAAINEGRCVKNLEEAGDETPKDWHDVLMSEE